jgi:hypothetical protein
MLEFLSYWLIFSLPVLLILLIDLKGKKRLIYTHTLLSDFQDRSLGDFLFRTFHLYYDVVLDLLLALLISLLLSGLLTFSAAKTAVTIDGSYSMLSGPQGRTPLDAALRRLEEPPAPKYDLYLLAFDPRRGVPHLVSLNRLRRRTDSESFRAALTGRYVFFNQDYSPCRALFERGYRRVLVLSDREAAPGDSLELISLGRAGPGSFFYPRSIGYDFAAGVFRLGFQVQNLEEEVTVSTYLEAEERYVEVPDAEMRTDRATLLCVLPREGLYRFVAGNLDFVFNLKKPVASGRVEGEFSRVILDTLPQLREGDGDVLLADLFFREASTAREIRRSVRDLGPFRRALITFLPAGDAGGGSYIHPLLPSLSRLGLTGFPDPLLELEVPGADLFFQDPPRLTDAQTPIVYLSRLESRRPPAYETLPAGKLSLEQSHRSSYVYRRDGEYVAVNLAAEEIYGPGQLPPLRVGPPGTRRVLVFALLLCCYLIKSVLLLLLNRPLTTRS